MLFFQFILYFSSFVGILKKEIPGAAPELWHLKSKQFWPDIIKFKRKHEDNLFNLNYSTVPRSCLYFMQARVDWVRIIFGTQVIKKKLAGSARVSRLSFCFLWLWFHRHFGDVMSYQRPKDVLKTFLNGYITPGNVQEKRTFVWMLYY